MKSDVEEYYSRRAHTYHDLDKPNTIVACVRAIGIEDHLEIIAPKPSEKILDMGCGSGRFLKPFSIAKVYGIDFTIKMLQKAKDSGVPLVRGDVEHLPFKSNAFDIVHSAGLLGVYRSKKILAEAARVAKKGGKMYVSFPATPSASGVAVKLFQRFYNPALLDYWYTKGEIKEMLPGGVIVLDIHRLGWEPPFQRIYRYVGSERLVKLFLYLERNLRDKPMFKYFRARFLLEVVKE
ncbi:MAG: class I SAM-dependent methyltransferase [Candidatus Hydrothermarchaeales archaeon]